MSDVKVEELRVLISQILDNFEFMKFDKFHPWHRGIVCLYCSVVEYADSIYRLCEAERIFSVPLILRSMLEAYVDLENLSNEPNYGNHLKSNDLKEWLKLAGEAAGNDNPYLSGVSDATGFVDQVQNWEDQFSKLKTEGYPPLTQFQKFERAGRMQEYKSLYNQLCGFSHNSIRALEDRHVEIEADNKNFSIVMFPDSNSGDVEIYVSACIELLRECSIKVHLALKTGREQVFHR